METDRDEPEDRPRVSHDRGRKEQERVAWSRRSRIFEGPGRRMPSSTDASAREFATERAARAFIAIQGPFTGLEMCVGRLRQTS